MRFTRCACSYIHIYIYIILQDIRRYARNLIGEMLDEENSALAKKAILLTIRDDVEQNILLIKQAFESIGSSGSSWIPLDESLSYDDVFSSPLEFQNTPYYELFGESVSEREFVTEKITSGFGTLQVGLIKPMNYCDCVGSMDNVDYLTWRGVHKEGKMSIIIKGVLPINPLVNDTLHRKGDFEFKNQLSMGPHPNIVPILHQFVGSSALLYPFLSKELKLSNSDLFSSSGRRLLRRYTTFYIFEEHTENLKNYKSKYFIMNERQLCFIALQLLDCVR